jgi:hypothetical protein
LLSRICCVTICKIENWELDYNFGPKIKSNILTFFFLISQTITRTIVISLKKMKSHTSHTMSIKQQCKPSNTNAKYKLSWLVWWFFFRRNPTPEWINSLFSMHKQAYLIRDKKWGNSMMGLTKNLGFFHILGHPY